MQSKPFLKPKMSGARFEGHQIPLEFLKDWSAFEEMVIEVAKWRFLATHSGRSRSPRGFLKGFSLSLSTTIEEGSAIANIVMSIASTIGQLSFTSDAQEYLEESRDTIVAAIGAAERNASITEHLPEKMLGHFNVFGRSLRDGESIEFPSIGRPVRLTKESRRRLLAAASKDAEIIQDMVIVGTVPEADQHKETFEIQTQEGQKLVVPDFAKHRETILEAFNGYSFGKKVRLRGAAKYNRDGKVESIDTLDRASVIEALDVLSRIEELKALKDGWFDGQGIALPEDGLKWFADAFDAYYIEQFVLPHVYPTIGGGIQAEWSLGKSEVSLEIDLNRQIGEWHQLNVETDADSSRTLDLNKTEDWDWIMEQLKSLGGLRND